MRLKTIILLFLILIFSFIVRLYWLSTVPPSLYTDEVNQGYNAYSILKTGRDEHGAFLPLSLRSFGDWKPPVPTYLMVPFISIFGLNELSIRLPSVFLGMGSIMLCFYITRLLGGSNKVSLIASVFMAASPWHIFESRIAMLVVVSLFFLEVCILGILKFFKKGGVRWALVSAFGLSISIYSYYGLRLIVPLFLLSLLYYHKNLMKIKKEIGVGILVTIVMLIPLLFAGIKNPDVLFGRAKTVSVFYDKGISLRKWELNTQDFLETPLFLTSIFHSEIVLYFYDISARFFSHFDPMYLFVKGDGATPFQIPGNGILNYIDFILLPLGLFVIFKTKKINRFFIISILLISFIPASLTFITPASNRSFNGILPFSIISAFGLYYLCFKSKVYCMISIFIFTLSFYIFMNNYFVNLPIKNKNIWNSGWKDVSTYLYKVKGKYDTVYISDREGMPYIYYLFYNKIDPSYMQKKMIRPYIPDEYGFEHVDTFENMVFVRDREIKEIPQNLEDTALFVVVPNDKFDIGEKIYSVKTGDDNEHIKIYEVDKK